MGPLLLPLHPAWIKPVQAVASANLNPKRRKMWRIDAE